MAHRDTSVSVPPEPADGQPRDPPADAKKNGMTRRKNRVLGDPAGGRRRVRAGQQFRRCQPAAGPPSSTSGVSMFRKASSTRSPARRGIGRPSNGPDLPPDGGSRPLPQTVGYRRRIGRRRTRWVECSRLRNRRAVGYLPRSASSPRAGTHQATVPIEVRSSADGPMLHGTIPHTEGRAMSGGTGGAIRARRRGLALRHPEPCTLRNVW